MARPIGDHQARIQKILDTAEPMFYNQGYRQTTIQDIVKELGVATGTVYYYFRSKEAILEALIQRRMNYFLEQVLLTIGDPNIRNSEKLERTLQLIFIHMRNRDGTLLFEFLNNKEDTNFLLSLSKLFRIKMFEPLTELIRQGQLNGEFKITYAPAGTTIILALLSGLFESIYDKRAPDVYSGQLFLTEKLVAQTLGLESFRLYVD